MIVEVFQAIRDLYSIILEMLGYGNVNSSSISSLGDGKLRVFIKYQEVGSTGVLQVDLDPSWSIEELKRIIAPKLRLKPYEMKIIFAGRELSDHIIIEDCNVGQQSYLHAVQILINKEKLNPVESLKQTNDTNKNTPSYAFFESESHHTYGTEEEHGAAEDEAETTENTPTINTNTNKSKSNFYVYCNVCQGLREGKLRVRCAVCQGGAFIVLRDPMSWDDVLRPNQVPGSCEILDCHNEFSQFYFKCSSHVTSGEDDSWPPLPQVKRNFESVPCLACGDAKEEMLVFDCTHATCIECFEQYSLLKLNEREFVQDPEVGYSLGCPVKCQNTLIKDSHHFKLMGKTQYDRYQRFGAEEFVLQVGGILCPQPDCGMGIINIETKCNKIACVHGCGFVFCRRCLEGWHMGDCAREGESLGSATASSSSYPTIPSEMAACAQWEDATRRTIKIYTKPCPKCRVPTQRDGGCMHMECTKCSFNWCWICQVQWSRDCMGNHWFE